MVQIQIGDDPGYGGKRDGHHQDNKTQDLPVTVQPPAAPLAPVPVQTGKYVWRVKAGDAVDQSDKDEETSLRGLLTLFKGSKKDQHGATEDQYTEYGEEKKSWWNSVWSKLGWLARIGLVAGAVALLVFILWIMVQTSPNRELPWVIDGFTAAVTGLVVIAITFVVANFLITRINSRITILSKFINWFTNWAGFGVLVFKIAPRGITMFFFYYFLLLMFAGTMLDWFVAMGGDFFRAGIWAAILTLVTGLVIDNTISRLATFWQSAMMTMFFLVVAQTLLRLNPFRLFGG